MTSHSLRSAGSFLLVGFAFFLTTARAAESRLSSSRPPNILFLFADDWGRHASILAETDGADTTHGVVRTPHFDRVARQGVCFRNAHVSAPSCTPCRSALLTGQHFWRTGTGSILQGAIWDASQPSFPLLLEDAGYHIGYSYKVWGPGSPGNAPFTPQQSYARRGGRMNQFSQAVTKMVADGQPLAAAKQEILGEVRGNFRDFLAARTDGQPFCYWFGPTNVHRKWVKGSGKALWGIDPDVLRGKLPPFLPDVPEVREDLADYFGEVAAWDAAIGAVLEELEATGERDSTLIVISGDHGAPGFPHGKCNLYEFGTGVCLSVTGPGVRGGRIVDDLVSLTDLAPTFLEAAGVKPPEVMTGRSLWTILRSAESGWVDPNRTEVFTGRERHVENARADFTPYPQRAIRTREHVLILNFRPDRWPLGDPYQLADGPEPTVEELENNTRVTLPDEDAGPTKAWLVGVRRTDRWGPHFEKVYGKRPAVELYDLIRDPHEMANVADDPAYATVRQRLEQRLRDELVRTGDPRLIDGGRFYETPPMAGPLTAAPKPRRAAERQSSATPDRRPNVLFIAIDDQNDWIGHLGGHPLAKTPHLDALAARGTSFTNAHCQAPLCNPSRTSLLVGLRPTTTGIYGLAPWFRTLPNLADRVTLPQHFAAHGYQTAATGKIYHGGTGAGGRRKAALGQDEKPEFATTAPYGGVGTKPPHKLVPPTPMGDHPLVDWGVWPLDNDDTGKGDYQVASWAVEQIDRFGKQAERRPFFLAAGFFLPHVPCYATQQWFDLYPDNDTVLPSLQADDRADTPRFSWYLHWSLPEPRLAWLHEAGQWRNLVRSYLACTSFVDAQIGRVLTALERSGLADNTVVVVWGDHGWHLGEKAITGKNTLWDRGTKVPLIFAGPGVRSGQLCGRPAELLDIYPTLVELCGLPARQDLEGTSLVPQLRNAQAPRERPAITSHNQGNHAIRSERWRYIHYADGSEELYDMQADPGEWTNLAGDERYAAVMAEQRAWLPTIDLPPAAGSAHRVLTYDATTDEAVWEGTTVRRGDPIPE
jgi:arylsulfatase A-like enzyme